jgi:fluoroquinolone resistance protein
VSDPSDPRAAILAELQAGDFFADRGFSDLALDGADLSGKELQRCTFRRCKLPASRWARSKLEDCLFEHCDLTRMVPLGLALRDVTFKDSKLMGVDWTDLGPLPRVAFEACDLRYASFVKLKLRATGFLRCTARESNFIDVDLTEADFTGSDLTDSTIRGCTLARTNLARATGVLFDVQGNRVKGARIGLEAALAMARAAGMVVESFEGD